MVNYWVGFTVYTTTSGYEVVRAEYLVRFSGVLTLLNTLLVILIVTTLY